jgi:hypothetical protein
MGVEEAIGAVMRTECATVALRRDGSQTLVVGEWNDTG